MTKSGLIGFLATVMIASAPLAWAGNGRAANLDALLQEALKNNPQIHAACNGILAAKALKPQAWALDNPLLTLENDNDRRNPFDTQHAEQNRFGLSQAIPFPGKLFGRATLASKELAVVQAQYEQAVNDVSRDVKKAYWDLFLALRLKELLEESRKALEAFRNNAGRKYSLGKASQADVLGAEVEMGKLLNELTIQDAQADVAQAALKALLNRSENVEIVFASDPENPATHKNVEDLILRAAQVNPALQGAVAEVDTAEARLELARLEYAPDLEFRAEYRQVDSGSDLWDGMLGVRVPLWAWKQEGMIAQSKAMLDQKKDMASAQKNKVVQEVREAYARAQGASKVVATIKAQVLPQAEQSLKVSETAYQNDAIDFHTLIGYWRILLTYRMDLQRAMAQHAQAMADLERAVGAG